MKDPLYRYKYKILEVCNNLHMICHGSTDWFKESVEQYKWLCSRIADWQPSYAHGCYEFDGLVYSLALCAKREYEAFNTKYAREVL